MRSYRDYASTFAAIVYHRREAIYLAHFDNRNKTFTHRSPFMPLPLEPDANASKAASSVCLDVASHTPRTLSVNDHITTHPGCACFCACRI